MLASLPQSVVAHLVHSISFHVCLYKQIVHAHLLNIFLGPIPFCFSPQCFALLQRHFKMLSHVLYTRFTLYIRL